MKKLSKYGSSVLDAAYNYLDMGLPVIPLARNTKKPKSGTHGYKDRIDTIEQLSTQEYLFTDSNLAIVPTAENHVFVVDMDVKNGIDGVESFLSDFCEGKEIPDTMTVITPSGGLHFYFLSSEGKSIPRKIGIVPGVDILGPGGHVVAPPSVTGAGDYVFEGECREIAEAPEWLIDKILADDPPPTIVAAQNDGGTLSGVDAGSRNNDLFRYAARLHARGLSSDEKRRLVGEAAANCTPPLPTSEVKQILKSVKRYHTNYPLTERGNALRMSQLYGDELKFSTDGHWYAYNRASGIWLKDDWAAKRGYDEAIELIAVEANNQKDPERKAALEKHYQRSQQAISRRGSMEMATTVFEPRLDASSLDANPVLLKVANGVVDLRTGELVSSSPAMLISKCAGVAYDEGATCPRFDQFLDDVTQGDEGLEEFIQRAVGYTLTAETSEQVMFVLYGDGENGKSTLVDVISSLLGDYSIAGPPQMLARRPRSQTNDLARLGGARMLTAAEEAAGGRMDEALVKQMTGGDTIAARQLYHEFVDMECRAKIWMTTNYHLQIEGVDHAIWRRIKVIPFDACFKGRRDTGLREALLGELPGILNWAIEGCRKWQADGLGSCAAVDAATNEYRSSSDVLYDWIQSRTADDPEEITPVVDLRDSFLDHTCMSAAEMSSIRFAALLKARGYQSVRRRHGVCYLGICLRRRRRRKRG